MSLLSRHFRICLYVSITRPINCHLRKTAHSHQLSAITHWRHLTDDQWEITPNICRTKCREVYLKSSQQSTRAIATLRQMPFGEKANIKYAENFVEESKDKRTNEQFEDTTENNVCTLSYYHHHQNWAYICHTYWRKKDHLGKKNSKSLKSNMFHMEHKLMTNAVSIELPSIWY